jgi:hypothetical protein
VLRKGHKELLALPRRSARSSQWARHAEECRHSLLRSRTTVSAASRVFNVSSGEATKVNDLAASICGLTASQSFIQREAERLEDMKHSNRRNQQTARPALIHL